MSKSRSQFWKLFGMCYLGAFLTMTLLVIPVAAGIATLMATPNLMSTGMIIKAVIVCTLFPLGVAWVETHLVSTPRIRTWSLRDARKFLLVGNPIGWLILVCQLRWKSN